MTVKAPIVVAIDFSPGSQALIAYAWKLAEIQCCDVHFLHVVPHASWAKDENSQGRTDVIQALQTSTGLPPGDSTNQIHFVHQARVGPPAREIVNYAKGCSAGTILIGTRGRGRLINVVLGSVAQAVIRDADCPVLVIPDSRRASLAVNEQRAALETDDSFEESFRAADRNRDAPDENRVIELLRRAIQWRATDVHIDAVGHDRVWIRFRVDGKLRTFCYLDQNLAGPLLMQLKLMADLDTTQTFEPLEARLKLPPALQEFEVRVTIVPACEGDAVALRLLKHEAVPRPLGSLGMSEATHASVDAMLQQRPGLVLVTGPTGTGKTTTVYAMLQALGAGDHNIVSIEDPVEYRVPGIRQISVNSRHNLTLTRGLKTLLRMDPDVVFIGEIRDVEALEIAMRASSSGRYVFSTLHTRDVASTVTALRDLHADNYSLAANLTGIVSQRLIRRLCPACRVAVSITPEQRAIFQADELEPPEEVFEPRGCPACKQSGYFDRVGIFEAVVTNGDIMAAIQRGAPEDELRRVIRSTQFRSLRYDALTKVREGITSLDEVSVLSWV